MTGHFYILPHKDRGGRSILFSSVGNLDFRSVENEVSEIPYVRYIILELGTKF